MGKTIMTIVVKAPKVRSLVMPRPGQTHADRRLDGRKYACRGKGRRDRWED